MVDREGTQYDYSFKFKATEASVSALGGAFVGLTGVGLGEVITTLLAVRHRFPLHLSTATSVFVVALTVLAAALTHSYFLFQDDLGLPWNLVLVMVLAVLVGGQIAPRLASKFPEVFLKRALVTMFLFVGSIMIWRSF